MKRFFSPNYPSERVETVEYIKSFLVSIIQNPVNNG